MYRTNSNSCAWVLAALLAVIATTHGFVIPKSELQNRFSTSLNEMITARNGLAYEEVEIGTGRNIFPGDSILCYYVGTYQKEAGSDNPFFAAFAQGGNTVTFDETEVGEPAEVLIGKGKVIKGWDIGICGDQSLDIPPMKIGGDRKLIIPAELAYGERGAGNDIPPNTDLEFQVEILNAERFEQGVSDSTKLKGFAALVGFLGFMGILLLVLVQNVDFLKALLHD